MNIFTNKSRAQRITAVAEVMRLLGQGCLAVDICRTLGITKAQLDDVAEDACAEATARSINQRREAVSARSHLQAA